MRYVDPCCPALAATFSRRSVRNTLALAAGSLNPAFGRSGQGFNLKSIREYQPFDDPRAVDWKLYGRSDRAFVREYHEDSSDEVAILVDTSASIACLERQKYLTLAGSVAWMILATGSGVRVWAYSGARDTSGRSGNASARTRTGYPVLATLFDRLVFGGTGNTAAAWLSWRKNSRHRRVVILSDFHEPALVPDAPAGGRLTLVRYSLPPVQPDADDEEMVMTDPETGASMLVPWNRAAKAAYRHLDLQIDARLASGRGSTLIRVPDGNDLRDTYWRILESLYA